MVKETHKCPECGEEFIIFSWSSFNVGCTECGKCGEDISWRSPSGDIEIILY